MKTNGIPILLAAALLASPSAALAQVGGERIACETTWGAATGGSLDRLGYGTLHFREADLVVAIDFVQGTAQRIVYRNPSLDETAIVRLLQKNSDGIGWDRLVVPGRQATRPDEPVDLRWMRTDEMALAQFSPGVLTILGAGWYQHVANPPPPPPPEGEAPGEAPEASEAPAEAAGTIDAPIKEPPAEPPEEITPTTTYYQDTTDRRPARAAAPRPDHLPAKGDRREVAVRILGQPTGRMMSGGREVMVYPWGKVWLADGMVLRVE